MIYYPKYEIVRGTRFEIILLLIIPLFLTFSLDNFGPRFLAYAQPSDPNGLHVVGITGDGKRETYDGTWLPFGDVKAETGIPEAQSNCIHVASAYLIYANGKGRR